LEVFAYLKPALAQMPLH